MFWTLKHQFEPVWIQLIIFVIYLHILICIFSIYKSCMIFQEPRKIALQLAEIWWENTIFCMEYHVYWLMESSYYEHFGDWKHCPFLIQKVDWKVISNRHFLSFHDISGLEKGGFWCSVSTTHSKNYVMKLLLCFLMTKSFIALVAITVLTYSATKEIV